MLCERRLRETNRELSFFGWLVEALQIPHLYTLNPAFTPAVIANKLQPYFLPGSSCMPLDYKLYSEDHPLRPNAE